MSLNSTDAPNNDENHISNIEDDMELHPEIYKYLLRFSHRFVSVTGELVLMFGGFPTGSKQARCNLTPSRFTTFSEGQAT